MRVSILIGLMVVMGSGLIQAATDYENDEQFFYVDEPINDSLESANWIICTIAAMRIDAFVNDGNYLAAVNPDDCDNDVSSANQAPDKPEKVSEKDKAVSGSSVSVSEREVQKSVMESLLNVTRDSKADPIITKAWIGHDDSDSGEAYARIKQTAGVSSSTPFGEFEMHWTYLSDISDEYSDEVSFDSWGFLKVEGKTISMIFESMEYADKITATYHENGNVTGSFEADLDVQTSDDDDSFYQGLYKFHISDADKSYCKTLVQVNKVSLKPSAEQEDLYTKQLVSASKYASLDIDPDEICYSTKISDTRRQVYSYGVYNQDGSSLDIGLTEMSLQAKVVGSDGEWVNVYADADSNYIWVDYEFAHLVDEDTVFKQEAYDNEVKEDKTYRLRPNRVSISKYETHKVSLDSLDAMPFEISGSQVSSYFKADRDDRYIDYEGIYIADTKTFKLTRKNIWDDGEGDRFEILQGDQYSFRLDQIMNQMTDNSDSFDLFMMHQGSFQITKQALENPNDETAVKTKVESPVSLSEMQGLDLFCVKNCISAGSIEKTFNQAKQILSGPDKDKDHEIISPYEKLDNGKKEDFVKYKFADGKVYDGDKQIFKSDLITDLVDLDRDYSQQLETILFADNNGNKWSIAWGLDAGFLVDSTDVESFKCTEGSTDEYCLDNVNFWDRKKDLNTYYALRYEIIPNFELLTENKQPVEFIRAKTLYYTVPEGDSEDANKRFALEYFGQGHLSGIPGHIYDISDGSEKGEYTDDWQESYRYIDRFMIPDGGKLVDGEGNEFKVKGLFGSVWLKRAPSFEGRYSYSGNIEQLPSDDQLFVEGGMDAFDIIGPKPNDKGINDGKPSVIHGEIIYDPTPNAK